MSWRTIGIYWALAAVLGVFFFGTLVVRGRAVDDVDSQTHEPLIGLASASVETLRSDRAGRKIEMSREHGRWRVDRPVGLTVSNDLVDALLDSLSTIPTIEVLTTEPGDVAQFGLDPPYAVLRMATVDGKSVAVEFGKRNPTRTALYARRAGEPTVYLLGLNAAYYLDLIYEQVAQQVDAARAS